MATTESRRETESGIEVKPVYTSDDVDTQELEPPGEFPFTRSPYRTMYLGRPWTIRQYAGFASAEETNERFRYWIHPRRKRVDRLEGPRLRRVRHAAYRCPASRDTLTLRTR